MNNEQRGVALAHCTHVTALMAALAADMTIVFTASFIEPAGVNHHLQRHYDIELAEKLALASLTPTLKITTDKPRCSSTGHNRKYAAAGNGNTVKWQLRDAQHCFNLNALAKSRRLISLISPPGVFSALLINAGIDRGNTDEIVQSIADYIDADDSPRFTAQKITLPKPNAASP